MDVYVFIQFSVGFLLCCLGMAAVIAACKG